MSLFIPDFFGFRRSERRSSMLRCDIWHSTDILQTLGGFVTQTLQYTPQLFLSHSPSETRKKDPQPLRSHIIVEPCCSNTKHTMRFLHLIRPVMCVLPEVASPDRKVRESPLSLLCKLFGNPQGRASSPAVTMVLGCNPRPHWGLGFAWMTNAWEPHDFRRRVVYRKVP